MLDQKFSTRFKKDLKKYEHKKDVIKEFNEVLKILLLEVELPTKYRDHDLVGGFIEYRECHIKSDVLLVYKVNKDVRYLHRIGSHSELF